jgi:hypothetical protein
VVLGMIESDWSEILSGPILGMLLFVIYINYQPNGLDNIFKMFADDNKVIAESGSK